MPSKILITGADGQLGKFLLDKLKDKFNVVPTMHVLNSLDDKRNIRLLDITKQRDVESIIHDIQPHIIINCAAYTNVDSSEKNKNLAREVNVVGLKNLINASSNDMYIVQISSDYVFDGDAGPYSEDDPTYPVNYYGKTKLEAENILRGSRNRFLIIRPNSLYSQDLFYKTNFFSWVYKSLGNNQTINVVNDQISNPTYTAHLSQAIFKCIVLKSEGIYHYGSDDYLSRYEFAISIAKKFEMDLRLIVPVSTKELMQNIPSYIAERPRHSGLITYKIENEIDMTTYSTDYSLNLLKNNFIAA